MLRAFITHKLADSMVAESGFPQGTACLIQLDIPDDLQKCLPGTFFDQGTEVGGAVAKMLCCFT